MIDDALHRELYNRALLAAHRYGDADTIADVRNAHARLLEALEAAEASPC
jgi:hypothetical protein